MPGKWIKPNKRKRIYLRDDYTCYMCGTRMESAPELLTLDHVKPRSRGGCNSERNIVTCCHTCNSMRRDTPLSPELRKIARRLTSRKLPALKMGV